MMKNKKIILVFTMIIVALVAMMGYVKASDDLDIQIVTNNNEQTNENNANTANNVALNTNNTQETNNTVGNNETTLPQTGVEENTVLFVAFLGVFTLSAVYAYKKMKNYKNI